MSALDLWNARKTIVPEINESNKYRYHPKPGRRSLPLKNKYVLRKDQIESIEWMLAREKITKDGIRGGFLASEPGLGKTLCYLSLCLISEKTNPSLIIVQKGLLGDIQKQIKKFFFECNYVVLDSKTKKIDFSQFDIVITTYETVRIMAKEAFPDKDGYLKIINNCKKPIVYKPFFNMVWDRTIFDESHTRIANHKSKNFESVLRLKARAKWCCTATSIKNRSREFWSQLLAMGFDTFTTLSSWNCGISYFYQTSYFEDLVKVITYQDTNILMPDLEQEMIYINLHPKIRDAYRAIVQNTIHLIEDVIEKRGSFSTVLAQLTAMRTLLSIPATEMKETPETTTNYPKIQKMLEIINLQKEKIVIFSSFKKHYNILKTIFAKNNISALFLQADNNRQKIIDSFVDGSAKVLVTTFPLGGVGLNLQVANCCIFMDPFWNFSTHKQALQRIWRVGQNRACKVYMLCAKDTIEEDIYQMCDEKKGFLDELGQGRIKIQYINKINIYRIESMLNRTKNF